MRKSFDGLHAIVKNTFQLNVLVGDLFVPLYDQFRALLMRDNIVMGGDTQVRLLTRGALDEVDLARLGKRRAKQRKNDGSMANSATGDKSDAHGSVTSYVWCYRDWMMDILTTFSTGA